MRNLLILGTGRSGTSMTAGLFRESGAYMGENSHAPRPANRFGFFEDAAINQLNDQILLRMLRRGWRRPFWRVAPPIHRDRQALWLAAPRSVCAVDLAPEVREEMRKHVTREPFCLKDPRFGLTLQTWRRELPEGTRFVVVFRDPDTTVDSMLREARERACPLPLTADWAYRSWYRMYHRLLHDFSREGHWLFVRYEQIANGAALPALEAFVGTGLCASQIQPDVRRAQPRPERSPLARRSRRLFELLVERAERDVAAWSRRSVASTPRVSVVMPVYDAERYVAEAVLSILAQTYESFELLVFDDGSRDGSLAILRELAAADPRIRLFEEAHAGYVTWLNRGLELARGELVARMDADDVALPERLERQVRFLDANPDVVALGTLALMIDRDGDPIAPTEKPLDHEEIDRRHLAPGCGGSMITHPTVMLRRRAALDAGAYRPDAVLADDLDLFLRLAERGRLANLPDVLLRYRIHPESAGIARRAEQLQGVARVVRDAYRRRGLAIPEGLEEALPRAGGPEANRRWIVRAARQHGFTRTARKHAFSALRGRPWSRDSWRLLRQAWLA